MDGEFRCQRKPPRLFPAGWPRRQGGGALRLLGCYNRYKGGTRDAQGTNTRATTEQCARITPATRPQHRGSAMPAPRVQDIFPSVARTSRRRVYYQAYALAAPASAAARASISRNHGGGRIGFPCRSVNAWTV